MIWDKRLLIKTDKNTVFSHLIKANNLGANNTNFIQTGMDTL